MFQMGNKSLIIRLVNYNITHALRHKETLQSYYNYNCFIITSYFAGV